MTEDEMVGWLHRLDGHRLENAVVNNLYDFYDFALVKLIMVFSVIL